jgi:pyruvate dehydrogenase E1 component alpha subunit
LIEAVTYRLSLHTTADDPTKYRTAEEEAEWEARDPLPRFQKYLLDKEVITEEGVEQVETEVKDEIQAGVDAAEATMKELGDPLEMFDHMYAEMPPTLQEQRDELARDLAAEGAEA